MIAQQVNMCYIENSQFDQEISQSRRYCSNFKHDLESGVEGSTSSSVTSFFKLNIYYQNVCCTDNK